MAFDDADVGARPEGLNDGVSIRASSTGLAVPVLHAQDVEIPANTGQADLLPLAEVEVVVTVGEDPGLVAEFTTSLFAGLAGCSSGTERLVGLLTCLQGVSG